MKKIISGALLLLLTSASMAQVVQSNFNWAFVPGPSTSTNTLNSPIYPFCNGNNVNFRVTSTATTICHAADQEGVPGWMVAGAQGILIPANPGAVATQNLPISFNFSEQVCNLKIHFVDLDAEETITDISTPFNNVIEDLGDLIPGVSMNSMASGVNNSTGWIEWDGPLNSLSFVYNRPESGFGLIIDSIIFECCTPPCKCDHRAVLKSTSSLTPSGFAEANVSLNSNGIAVRSICVNLPFYQSNVDIQCLKCDVDRQETFGTILNGSPINGVIPILDDPYNLGYSRTLCWTFNTPTIVNQNVQIGLQFPETLELNCCKNSASYCLDVTFRNNDCTTCEYQICSEFPKNDGNKESRAEKIPQSNTTTIGYNDFAEPKTFELSPNPSSGKITIQLLNESLIDGKLIIYNTEGKNVHQGTMAQMKETIQLDNIAPGMYTVIIESNGQISSERLIIK